MPARTGPSGFYDGKLDFRSSRLPTVVLADGGLGAAIYLGPPSASGTVTGMLSFANKVPLGRKLLRIRVLADKVVDANIAISETELAN